MTSITNFVTDFAGNSFPVKKYSRIVSLVPSLTDLLFSFGLENSIVGVTKYCVYPARAQQTPRKIVGGTKNPNIQQILALEPDIVLVNQEENQLKHYQALIDAHIHVFVTFPRTINEAVSLFYDLKRLFSVPDLSEFEELERTLKQVSEVVKNLHIKKTVFCPIWKKPWMSFNSDTFGSSMIRFCGGKNITDALSDRYPEISIDQVIQAKPDIILLPDEPYHFQEKDKEEFKALFTRYLPNIELIKGTFHWYSFIMIQSLKELFTIISEEK